MAYEESRLAAHSGSPKALQGKIGHESKLHAPDADKLAGFKHKLLRILKTRSITHGPSRYPRCDDARVTTRGARAKTEGIQKGFKSGELERGRISVELHDARLGIALPPLRLMHDRDARFLHQASPALARGRPYRPAISCCG